MLPPNLFVVGAPKSGTTSLHDWLGQHPSIYMSRRKEPKYWLSPGVRPDWSGPGDEVISRMMTVDHDAYTSLFADRGDARYAGESSPYYLWDADALRRIREERPDARILVLLRQPEERAYSNWGHLWQDGREVLDDVVAAVRAEPARRRAGWEPFWFYRSLGLYGEQLERLRTLFPLDQVHVELFDELSEHPQQVLSRIFRFLEVDDVDVQLNRRNTTTYYAHGRRARLLQRIKHTARYRATFLPRGLRHRGRKLLDTAMRSERAVPGLDPVTYDRLHSFFEADLERLSALAGEFGLDLSAWRRPEGLTARP